MLCIFVNPFRTLKKGIPQVVVVVGPCVSCHELFVLWNMVLTKWYTFGTCWNFNGCIDEEYIGCMGQMS